MPLINTTATEARNRLALPEVGDHELRVLSPTVLELFLVDTKDPDPARIEHWDFVDHQFRLRLPPTQDLRVLAGGKPVVVQRTGFKRRVLYAPLKKRDLRIGSALYLELALPLKDGQSVEVLNPNEKHWPKEIRFRATAEPRRVSPVIHVNQVGYLPQFSKKAMIGYYLGSMGELPMPERAGTAPEFLLLNTRNGEPSYRGELRRRMDRGFTFPCYQQVWEADFTAFTTQGEYQLFVPGLGVSLPFLIDDGIAGAFARAYALGLYHQRCGAANHLPFTRFVHQPCHLAPAAVPTDQFEATEHFLKETTADAKNEPRHTAPPLSGFRAALYPFVRQGSVDVAGGHHDAGDYSKYTINSAALVHYLVFAADSFGRAGALDNLGLPESGDGKSDLLQEAKWEADFLAKTQDTDGGFSFLIYPRERKYEDDVLPDQGDPQVVWPKNTAATAAAVAALAQASSSPLFRKQFPEAAKRYREQALKGWQFLERAIAKHGRDGAYQKLTHYGHEFLHDDELAWAATELYLATGDRRFERQLLDRFDPEDRTTRHWTWWRLFEAYGCAVRSYAFAAKTGRLKPTQLNSEFLRKCENELVAAAEDQTRFARESAYGTSFPDPTKRFRTAGWYFSIDRAFDIVAALQLESTSQQKPEFLQALLSNINYEAGCNPVNVTYLTGLGWKRQREIVHHYAQNDRRTLPPSGLPIGNIQAGFQFLHHYEKELGKLSFPPDGVEDNPYPFYDRWGDSFNVSTEFVVVNQARGLAALAWLMAEGPLRNQPWRTAQAKVTGLPTQLMVGQTAVAELAVPGLDLRQARIVWEAAGHEPAFGPQFRVTPRAPGPFWVEAEIQCPDGRRAFAVAEFEAIASDASLSTE